MVHSAELLRHKVVQQNLFVKKRNTQDQMQISSMKRMRLLHRKTSHFQEV